MGTRCLTHFKDADGTIATMYRQFDGYPEGHGSELMEFLQGFKVVNGFSGEDYGKIANGMGCLAAQAVAHFKKDSPLGGIYLYPADSSDCGEEWTYTVTCENDHRLTVIVTDGDSDGFSGPVDACIEWIKAFKDRE